MSNLCAESSIIHEQDVQILDIMDQEFFQTVGKVISGFLIGAVADFGHWLVASKASPHSVINAMRSSPALSHSASVEIRLKADEFLSSFLDDSFFQERSCLDHKRYNIN